MKKKAIAAVLCMAAAVTFGNAGNVKAAEVSDSNPGNATQAVTVVKENAVPTFSVEIPESVTVTSGEAQEIAYSISEEDLSNIPEGKKVAILLEDAGYGDTAGRFALWNGESNTEATYNLYGSKYATRPSDAYQLGGKGYVSFYGNEHATDGKYTMTRVIKVNDFDNLEGGSYEGYISYSISLADAN